VTRNQAALMEAAEKLAENKEASAQQEKLKKKK